MTTVYLYCAAIGGLVLVIQFTLSLLGIGHDGFGLDHGGFEVHGDADHSHFLGILSIRAISAAVAFFGLGGMLATGSRFTAILALMIAMSAGIAAMFLVAWMMRLLASLGSEGTVQIGQVIGSSGKVYLTVPGGRAGVGKVTVSVQNRTMEYPAVTSHDTLATGSPIVVIGIVEPETLEVVSTADDEGEDDA